MNVVDSSGWLEYFADGPNAGFFAPPIEDLEALLVPSISILEVFRRVLEQRGERDALEKAAVMQLARVVNLDAGLAILAGRIGREERLPLADSVMLASARAYGAVLWTQDRDFKGFDGVRYVAKK